MHRSPQSVEAVARMSVAVDDGPSSSSYVSSGSRGKRRESPCPASPPTSRIKSSTSCTPTTSPLKAKSPIRKREMKEQPPIIIPADFDFVEGDLKDELESRSLINRFLNGGMVNRGIEHEVDKPSSQRQEGRDKISKLMVRVGSQKDGKDKENEISKEGHLCKVREDAGETLIYLSATEKSAKVLVECQITDVCTTLLLMHSTPERIIVQSLCILANLISLACFETLLKSRSLHEAINFVLTTSADPAVLSQCLKIYIIIFSGKEADSALLSSSSGLLGEKLSMIQMTSLDPELLARSWELVHYIVACESSQLIVKDLLTSWNISTVFRETSCRSTLELLQSAKVDGISGISWLLMSFDSIFAESTKISTLLIEMLCQENSLQSVLSCVISLPFMEVALSREESFYLISCLESLLCHIPDEEVEPKLSEKDTFVKISIFILSVALEIILARDKGALLALMMIVHGNLDLIRTHQISPLFLNPFNELIEVHFGNTSLILIIASS